MIWQANKFHHYTLRRFFLECPISTLQKIQMTFPYKSNATDSSNYMISHFMRHLTDILNAIMKSCNMCPSWSVQVGIPVMAEKKTSALNHTMWHQLQIMLLIRLLSVCHCCMLRYHNIYNQIWKKRFGFFLNMKCSYILAIDTRTKSGHSIMYLFLWVFHPFYFGPRVALLNDRVKFKKSTTYNVWFSRNRSSSFIFTPDFALVLVFVNFLWVVYNNFC